MIATDNFDIYVGGKLGVFKGIRIQSKECTVENIQSLMTIGDDDVITSMSWGNDDETEILIASGVKEIRRVKVYDTNYSTFTCSFHCNVGTGKISGISRYNESGAILTGVHSGCIKLWRFKEEDGILMNAGENMEKMCHSKVDRNLIATGGLEHRLKLFDLETQTMIFNEKNLPHDWLQLRVPIWISDINFLPTGKEIITVGRYGHVRLYDPKAQRRPVINLETNGEALTCLSLTQRDKQIIVGSGKGKMNLVDLRKPSKILNTYKGFAGGVTGIACSKNEPYIVSVSLDRFLRVHHIDTKALLKKVYLTSKLSAILLRSEFSIHTDNITDKNTENHENEIHETDKKKQKQKKVSQPTESDSELDVLFDKMPVVSKEENIVIARKRKKTKTNSSLNNEVVRQNSSKKIKKQRGVK